MKQTILPAVLFVFLFFLSAAVQAQPPCGFDIRHKQLLRENPAYARQIASNEASIKQFILAHPNLNRPSTGKISATYTIPVVVHVMHTGGLIGTTYNPTDAQIIGAIQYLNQVYAGTYSGMTAASTGGAAGDMDIQFALAQRTPVCGATNGIDRVNATALPNYTTRGINADSTNGCPELTMKNLARWNTANYYNIWIVNKIDGKDGTLGQFIAGFAYFPGSPSTLDGTVMLATQMIAGQKTLPHEVGHALNLFHPFEGSDDINDCPSSDCINGGDRCCDTDPITNNNFEGFYDFSCRTGQHNDCTGGTFSINTESNFMNYTNCYSLFTNDQRARVQAAMSLASRANLVSPSNLALTPCGTSINFNTSSGSAREDITGTLTGCRRYKDYAYQMGIGGGPSEAATVTLSFSGSATRGLDYEVTTNGDFSNPSNVLNFASASTTPQAFTVRIYDDGDLEPTDTAILDFTVNAGTGNATKGTAIPTLKIAILDNDVAPVGSSTGTFSVGALGGTADISPFDARRIGHKAQYLYKASELIAAGLTAGTITNFQLFVNTKLSTRPFGNLSIKMTNTPIDYILSGGNFSPASTLTTVFGPVNYSTVAGWNNFTLSTPFEWDGTSGLSVEICFGNASVDNANAADEVGYYFDGGGSQQANFFYQDDIDCGSDYDFNLIEIYGSGVKPIIRLSNVVSATPVETVAGATAADYIGVGSNDIFYTNNNKLLMNLRNLNADLGCVSAGLDEGGTTWSNYLGGQRSAKVFAITPTTNGAAANYTLSLYFDNTELGGKPASGLKIAKTSAASVAAATAANTMLLSPVVSTLGTSTTIFTGTFTGFSRFFLVDGGVTLPIGLLDFSATADGQGHTLLHWQTSSEENNRDFTVETSLDGISFTAVGVVPSQGNSHSPQAYDFLHNTPQPGTNWYRLKQTDFDGKFNYSKTVYVNVVAGTGRAFLFPVPAKESVTINFNGLVSKTDIEVFSPDMKVVRRERVEQLAARKEIDLRNLPAGVYFVRLSGANGSQVLRFVKQ